MNVNDFGLVRDTFGDLLAAVADLQSAIHVHRGDAVILASNRLEEAVSRAKRAFSAYQNDQNDVETIMLAGLHLSAAIDSLLSRLPPPGETLTNGGDRGEATLPGPTRHCRCGRHLEQHNRILWCPDCGSLDFDDQTIPVGSPPSPPSAWAQAGELLGAFRRELDAAGSTGELLLSAGRETFTYHVRMVSNDHITTWNWTFSHLELQLAVNLDSIAASVMRRWRDL